MNNRKIKITESQFNKILKLMTETPFDQMVKQSIEVGDVIRINWKNSYNNFKVINANNGQIIMDNIDTGSANVNNRYFMSYTSLNGDDLDLRMINKKTDASKLNDIKTWKTISVKDLSNIEIFRDNQLVDTVDPMSPTAEKTQKKGSDASQVNIETDFMDKVNDNLAIIIEQLNKDNGINLIFTSGYVNFCCVDKKNTEIYLEVNKNENTTLIELNKWDTFILDLKGNPDTDNLYLMNKDIVSTNDGITYNLKFKVKSGTVSKDFIIKSIKGVSVLPDCSSSKEDMSDKSEEEEDETDEENLFNAEKALEMIINDPDLKNAFYKQPTFWERFKADLSGKKAKGTGIITTLGIINKYVDSKIENKIGKGFIRDKVAKFRPIEPIVIKYTDTNNITNTYKLPRVEDDIIVRRYKIDYILWDLRKHIPDSSLTLRILVKEKTDNPNIKLCDVEIGVEKGKEFDNKGSVEDVEIEFLNSEGYETQKDIETDN